MSPLRILVTTLFWLQRRTRTVVTWTVGGERRTVEPKAFEKTLQELHALAADPRVEGLRIDVRSLQLGWSQLYLLRTAILGVAKSGTRVEAYLASGGGREWLLATAADHITMPPPAELLLSGVASSARFYGPALERVGVHADLESAGAYKSFGESYTRGSPTPQNREAMDHLLGALHKHWVETASNGRELTVSEVEAALATSPISADQAVEQKLIDVARYPDQDWDAWKERLGGPPRKVALRSHARLRRWLDKLPSLRKKKQLVAVVHLDGPVVERREQMPRSGRVIASDDVIPVLDELIENDQLKAVVLAVNSPGGSALASDLIARKIAALKEKKPVVAAMGNVAASGGYYISALADEIWAHPSTITGSIGVVGGKIVIGPALAKLGIHTTWMGPAPEPGMFTPDAPFEPNQRRRYRASLRRVYDRFINIVATGRGKEPTDIEPVAQGRVWTGTQAVENGLVDHLGSLDQAVEAAARRADIPSDRLKVLPLWFDPPKFGFLTQAMGGSTINAQRLLSQAIGTDAVAVQMLQSCPLEALALEPSVLDSDAWAGWLVP